MRQKLAQLFQVTQGKDWFPIVGLVFVLALLLIFITGPVDFLNLGLLGQRKTGQTSEASKIDIPLVCNTVSVDADLKKDKDKAKDQTKLLNLMTTGLLSKKTDWEGKTTDSLSSEMIGLLKERKKLVKSTFSLDSEAALASTLMAKDQFGSLAEIAPGCIEEQQTIEGTLEVLHKDIFDDKYSTRTILLTTEDGGKINLWPAGQLHIPLESGNKVKVRGLKIDNDLIFDGSSSTDIQLIYQARNQPVLGIAYAQSANNAEFISQVAPPTLMAPGQTANVAITMRNTGTTTWTAGVGSENYLLGSQNPQDNSDWGFSRVELPSNVVPGSEVTLNFTITAPNWEGQFNFQWQMVQEYVEWFGTPSNNVEVTVTGSPAPTPSPGFSPSPDPSSSPIPTPSPTPTPAPAEPTNVLVLMAYFQNTPQPPYTKNNLNQIVFSEVKNYYLENSYNKMNLTGNVFGWYQLPIGASCDLSIVTSQAVQAADADVNFQNYSHLIIYAPFDACGNQSAATVGKQQLATADGQVLIGQSWISTGIDEAMMTFVTAHELGHNFGNEHASYLDCGDIIIADFDCTVLEQGDYYDVMGGLDFNTLVHFNAAHKEYVGWLTSDKVINVTNSGQYTIEPIEKNTDAPKALKIQRGESGLFYIEYRQPIGYDANISHLSTTDVFSGALIHSLQAANETLLLDMSPFDDRTAVALQNGGSFFDPVSGVRISVLNFSENSMTVDVTPGKNDFTPPQVVMTSPVSGSIVSQLITLSASASDESGIQRIEYYHTFFDPELGIITQQIGTAVDAPYNLDIDTNVIPDGPNLIFARAFDRAGELSGVEGNHADSAPVSIIVDNTLPQVTITSPQDASSVSGNNVKILASAVDDLGIDRVEFFLDGLDQTNLIGSDTASPYNIIWDSTTTNFGDHVLIARAYDQAGNFAESNINLIVKSANRPPSLTLLDPDVNDDVAVTIADIGAVQSTFGAIDGGANYNPFYDLTADGAITLGDIGLVAGYFGVVYWPPFNSQSQPVILTTDKIWQLYLTATDPDNNLVTISASNLPTNANFTTDDIIFPSGIKIKRAHFIWTPKANQKGKTYKVEFKADDGQCGITCTTQTLFLKVR